MTRQEFIECKVWADELLRSGALIRKVYHLYLKGIITYYRGALV